MPGLPTPTPAGAVIDYFRIEAHYPEMSSFFRETIISLNQYNIVNALVLLFMGSLVWAFIRNEVMGRTELEAGDNEPQ